MIKTNRKTKKLFVYFVKTLPLFVFVILIGFYACLDFNNKWMYEKVLPGSASAVKVYIWQDEFLTDYEYYLKAQITKRAFLEYVDSLELKLHTKASTYSDDTLWLSISGVFCDSVKSWWNDIDKDSLYVWQKGHEWNIARYIDGYLYFYAMNH